MKKLYFGGPIITMEKKIYEEAVLTENGVIIGVGGRNDFTETDTELVFLEGCTMAPAFIDSHSHITAMAQNLSRVDLSIAESIDGIISGIKIYSNVNPKAGFILGYGFDENNILEHRRPSKEELDDAAEAPVMIVHASGVAGVANTKAMEILHINSESASSGYIEGEAFQEAFRRIPDEDFFQFAKKITEAERMYRSSGYVLIQEGRTDITRWEMLKAMAEKNMFTTDIVCYADIAQAPDLLAENPEYRSYQNHLRIGGYKLFLDGKLQEKTGWLSKSYECGDYLGEPYCLDEEVEGYMKKALDEGTQIIVHANGDAAIEQMLRAAEKIEGISKIRPVLLHGLLASEDQLARMSKLGITASFYAGQTYNWGDTHIKNLGIDRAGRICPAASALREGVNITLHDDTQLPDALGSVWCACRRETRNGIIIGEEQKISVLAALKAVTLNAAVQYGEEEKRGSIKAGKNADFVILDKNPLAVTADEIRDIKILRTIVG